MALRKAAGVLLSKVASAAAHSYIAGPAVDNALAVGTRFLESGWQCSLGPWNAISDSPRSVFEQYAEAIRRMPGWGMYLSIKMPALDFEICLLNELLSMAEAKGVVVHFDSLALETAGRTFQTYRVLSASFPGLGYTLPARWRRSIADAEYLKSVDCRVRIVKGQWEEPGNVDNVRESYLRLVNILSGAKCHVEIATHDAVLAEQSIGILASGGAHYSLGQLYGLPVQIARRRRQRPLPVSVYVPYGHAYLPYAVSQVLRQPRALWWLVRDAVRGAAAPAGAPELRPSAV